MVNIVKANAAHVDSLVHLNTLVQKIHYEAHPDIFKYPIGVKAAKKEFLSNIEDDDHHIYIAILGRDVVGYIWAQHIKRPESALSCSSDKMHVHHISVEESQRQSGVGKRLIQKIEKVASTLAVDHMTLDYWCFNKTANTFFEKSGYRPFNVNLWKPCKSFQGA